MSDTTPTSLEGILKDYATAIVDNCLAIMDDPDADFKKPHDTAHAKALAAIQALIPEKFDGHLTDKGVWLSEYDRGRNDAIDTIQRNFTGQRDDERKQ